MVSGNELAGLNADPLYLTALASLGTNIPARLTAAPSKSSIAVLPFVDMSGETGHEHFSDGLTEAIITDLSNVPGFFVIARNSVFAYKGKPSDVRQIAHDLGVKYILEGSARRSNSRLRINVQLIDAAEGGNHIWAERFDRELVDIFAVQDEVTRRVVEAITGKIGDIAAVERNRPASLEAYDLCVQSRNLWAISKSTHQEAVLRLEQAIQLDPNYCEAHWRLAFERTRGWLTWGEPPEENRERALKLAQRAVEIDPNNSDAHWAKGYALVYERLLDAAEMLYETSLQLNPNNADAFSTLGDFQVIAGKPQEAVLSAARALRLNPRPPGWYYLVLGFTQIAIGDYENAIFTLRREETYRTVSRRLLAAALVHLDRTAEAQTEAKLFIATSPHWRISTWLADTPFKHEKDAKFWADSYREAGLPE